MNAAEQIDRIVRFWIDCLLGQGPETSPGTSGPRASVVDALRAALQSGAVEGITPEQILLFEALLTQHLQAVSTIWLHTDYQPDKQLVEVCERAGIRWRYAFPIKTATWVDHQTGLPMVKSSGVERAL